MDLVFRLDKMNYKILVVNNFKLLGLVITNHKNFTDISFRYHTYVRHYLMIQRKLYYLIQSPKFAVSKGHPCGASTLQPDRIGLEINSTVRANWAPSIHRFNSVWINPAAALILNYLGSIMDSWTINTHPNSGFSHFTGVRPAENWRRIKLANASLILLK